MDFLHHVTQLDLRDNKLGELDATVFNNVEVLHCERNQLVTLKISGYFLKALYASSNGKCVFKAAVVLSSDFWFCTWFSVGWLWSVVHIIRRLLTWPLDKRVSYVLYHATGSSDLQKRLSNNTGLLIWRSQNCENLGIWVEIPLYVSRVGVLKFLVLWVCINVFLYLRQIRNLLLFPRVEKVRTSGRLWDKLKQYMFLLLSLAAYSGQKATKSIMSNFICIWW